MIFFPQVTTDDFTIHEIFGATQRLNTDTHENYLSQIILFNTEGILSLDVYGVNRKVSSIMYVTKKIVISNE